jgi:excinuclease ABC subunit B
MPARERKKLLDDLNAKMKQAAKMLEFEEAARLRDEIAKIKRL